MQEGVSYFHSVQDLPYIPPMDDPRTIVAKRAKDLGIDLAHLSREAGMNHAYAQQFVTRGTPKKLPEEVRTVWARLLQVPEQALRGPSPRRVASSHLAAARGERDMSDQHATADITIGSEGFAVAAYQAKLAGGVPEIDAEVGAGEGTVGEVITLQSSGILSGHVVNAEWVIPRRHLDVNPARVIAVPVVGTSMEPALKPTDIVFVDLHATTIRAGEIYVIAEDDAPMVKRIRLNREDAPMTIEIISENPAVAPYRRPADLVRIIGRVIGKFSRM